MSLYFRIFFCFLIWQFFSRFFLWNTRYFISNLINNQITVGSAVFWIDLFDAVFIASVVDFLALSRSFLSYLLLKLLPVFFAKEKNPYPFTSLGSIEYLIFICYLYLITIVKFILSSISNWLVNHTLISSYSELNGFKKIWFVGEISNKLPKVYLEQKYIMLLNLVDNHY